MKNVPKLRFKGFSGEWQTKKLDQYLIEYKERVPATTSLPILTSSRNGLFFQRDYFNDRELKNDGEYGVVPRGYFTYRLMSDDATFKFNINNLVDMGAISKEYPVFTTKNMNSYFLLQKLNYGNEFKEYAITQRVGGTRTRLYFKKLVNLFLKITSIEEQTKIADFLTAIDDRISQLAQKCELLEQYKKAVMQQIFSQELRFKDEEGREFPAWDSVDLGNLAFKVNTKNKDDSISKVLTNSAVQGIVSQNDFFDKDIANKNNLEGYYVVELNDFVYNPRISSSAPVGPIKRNKLAKGVMSPLYTVFRFKSGCLDFLEYFFETTYWHDHMKSVSNMGARFDRINITNEGFFSLPIALPSVAEQEKIAEFLSAVDEKISQAQAQLEAAKRYKQGLLQQMFV